MPIHFQLAVEFPSEDERIVWWNIFLKGSAFRAFARFLLYGSSRLGLIQILDPRPIRPKFDPINTRVAFQEKFLFWKVLPTCCLGWILHFAVFECAPDNVLSIKSLNTRVLSETVQHLVAAWSKSGFVQSAPIERQVYVTAALGLCLEKMGKEDLDATKDALPTILRGISCRLESPENLVRKMASSIAFVFSKVRGPKNTLDPDDCCWEETIDWEFGKATPIKGPPTAIVLEVNENFDRETPRAMIPVKEI
ncbi:uncharacterized protein LOC142549398 [Primulina tabacum]|uniref:uncharacterized protein LOC142549398 n=1 Tax=Primulina tabacum TaxID=48773 RepID=UPI003F5A663E